MKTWPDVGRPPSLITVAQDSANNVTITGQYSLAPVNLSGSSICASVDANGTVRLSVYGVGFRSFTEAYFDSCGIWKDAIIGILATLAKQERLRISERVRAGLDRARANGKRLGRPRKVVDARRIAALRAEGASWATIGTALGVGEGTVRRAALASAKNLSADPAATPCSA